MGEDRCWNGWRDRSCHSLCKMSLVFGKELFIFGTGAWCFAREYQKSRIRILRTIGRDFRRAMGTEIVARWLRMRTVASSGIAVVGR